MQWHIYSLLVGWVAGVATLLAVIMYVDWERMQAQIDANDAMECDAVALPEHREGRG